MRRALREASRRGHRAVLLVGDDAYYGRFGFSAERTGACGCRGSTRRTGCSAANSAPGALDGARGVIRAPSVRRGPAGSRRRAAQPPVAAPQAA